MKASFYLAAAIILFIMSPLKADNRCALEKLADLQLKTLSNGDLAVPVSIGGKPQWLLLALTAPFSLLSDGSADVSKYKTHPMPLGVQVVPFQGGKVIHGVSVPDFGIGNAHGTDVRFLATAGAFESPTVGQISADILSNFDVELDVANSRMNLFKPNECENVVYWKAESYAKVPFRTDTTAHPIFTMTLDGKALDVDFMTTHGNGRMGLTEASRLFGIDVSSIGMTALSGDQAAYPYPFKTIYRYPFKKLSIGGVVINNPVIDLYPDSRSEECRPAANGDPTVYRHCYGGADLGIGLTELRALHIYFAMKRKTLYVTAADPMSTALHAN